MGAQNIVERPDPAAPAAAALAADELLIDAGRLQALVNDVFLRAAMPGDEAALVADALVLADLRGMHSHGVLRVPIYVEKIRGGGFRPGRKGRVVRETTSTVLLDGECGIGQVLTVAAMDRAIGKAKEHGIGAAGVFNSNHHGEAAYYVLQALKRDMIALVATNGSPNMPAWGGKTKMTGPLPFTAGAPALEEDPFVIDAALGVTNRGKLIYMAARGEKIPFGWGVDRNAQPTDDPAKVLDGGWILPIGGHKGFGITMFVEIISGVLTGALIGSAIRDLYNAPRDLPQGLGHFCIAIDPGAFMPVEQFKRRMDEMIRMIKRSELAPGTERMIIPGQFEFEKERERRVRGIPLARKLVEQLRALAAELGSPHTI
ncbi:MAG TPA: Ldh family oxidoreductase [Pseudolabrys sp.]|nr:Ldh family oxidoreductase [Pseudolabrys sp.]